MNSVGDEPSGITGIKSGVRSQIGFWDSFYQKTTFNYWFETRSTTVWPRKTTFDRGWQDCGWYDHFWNVLKRQSFLIRKKLSRLDIKKWWAYLYLMIWVFFISRFWLVDLFLSSDWFFLRLFSPSIPISKKKILSQKNKNFKNFQKSRIFWKLKFGRIYYF